MKHAVARCEIAAIVRRAKAFIFDFDGTLVDSNSIKLPYTGEAEARLQESFATATTQPIIEAREVPGAEVFLRTVRMNHMTALLSSAPHETLLQIVSKRGWNDYFDLIQEAPAEKSVWLRRLLEERQVGREDVAFFGDTQEDANAAQAAQCLFVAVVKDRVSPDAIYPIEDFTELVGIESSC